MSRTLQQALTSSLGWSICMYNLQLNGGSFFWNTSWKMDCIATSNRAGDFVIAHLRSGDRHSTIPSRHLKWLSHLPEGLSLKSLLNRKRGNGSTFCKLSARISRKDYFSLGSWFQMGWIFGQCGTRGLKWNCTLMKSTLLRSQLKWWIQLVYEQ